MWKESLDCWLRQACKHHATNGVISVFVSCCSFFVSTHTNMSYFILFSETQNWMQMGLWIKQCFAGTAPSNQSGLECGLCPIGIALCNIIWFQLPQPCLSRICICISALIANEASILCIISFGSQKNHLERSCDSKWGIQGTDYIKNFSKCS
jgi:hypothetical protein